jgi:hypothetical protein
MPSELRGIEWTKKEQPLRAALFLRDQAAN